MMDESALDPPTDILKAVFKFDIASPKVVDLSSYFGPRTPTDTRNTLRDASNTRREMTDALSGNSSPSTIISHASEYLDTAMRLMATESVLENEEERKEKVTELVEFSWTSVLDNRPRGAQWITKRAFGDAAFTLVAIATSHCNAAHEALQGTADLIVANKELRRAAGVFQLLVARVLKPNRTSIKDTRPIEFVAGFLSGLASACLAQAQQCMAFTAEATSKPASLIAKLLKGCADKYREALTSIQTGVTSAEYRVVDPRTMESMTVMADVTTAVAHKFQGRDEYAKGNYGEAVFHMRRATQGLAAVLERGVTGSLVKSQVKAEMGHCKMVQEQYELENRTIYFVEEPEANKVADIKSLFAVKVEAFEERAVWSETLQVPSIEPERSPAPSSDSKVEDDSAFVYAEKPTVPEGRHTMKFACSNCTKMMEAPAGSPAVACPHCKKVNINIACGACDKVVSFLQGHTQVRCPSCSIINRVKA